MIINALTNSLITKQEAAEILELSDSGVSFLARRGDLPEVRFSKRRVLYELKSVENLAEKRQTSNII